MKSAERLTVLCSLLLLYALFSAPLELFSLLWRHDPAAVHSPVNDRNNSRTTAVVHAKLPATSAPGLSTNYASLFLRASVVSVEPSSCHGGSALISDSVDKYVLCPCAAPRKQFVVQLIRDVEVRAVMVRNAEHFSSGVRNFTLLGSRRYPTASWEVLGSFEAEPRRGRQYFDVVPHSPVRYVKLQWATSHGSEPWCTITSFQVFGLDVLETLTRFGEDEEDGVEGAESVGAREESGMASIAVGAAGAVVKGKDLFWPPLMAAGDIVGDAATREAETVDTGDAAVGPTAVSAAQLDDLVSTGLWDEVGAPKGAGGDAALTTTYTTLIKHPGNVTKSGQLRNDSASALGGVAAVLNLSGEDDWTRCSSSLLVAWNSSLQCPPIDFLGLLQMCATATCDPAEYDASPHSNAPSSFSSASSTAASPAEPNLTKSTQVSSSNNKPLHQSGVAGAVLAQLLRQQRSQHQELVTLSQRETQLLHELNRTRGVLSDVYVRYRDSAKESTEQRERLRALTVEVQLLHQRLLLREQSAETTHGGFWRNETVLALAAFILSVLAVVVVFVSAMSSSPQLVGSPSGWGRQFSLSGGGVGGEIRSQRTGR